MAQVSVKDIANDCLGVTPKFSVVEDFFDFPRGYQDKTYQLSLKDQIDLISGECMDLNIQVMGYDGLTSTQRDRIESACQYAREIYAQIDVGIRHLNWIERTEAQVGDYLEITDTDEDGEHAALMNDENYDGSPTDFVDCFFVPIITGTIMGLCVEGGSCDTEENKYGNSGLTVEIGNWDGLYMGQCLAHELGHYHGLTHNSSSSSNLMYPYCSGTNIDISTTEEDGILGSCAVTVKCS